MPILFSRLKNTTKLNRPHSNTRISGGGNGSPFFSKPLSCIDYLLNNKLELVIAFLLLVWLIPIFLYPFVSLNAVHWFFGFTCHQNPCRSFSVNHVALPVCARCTGVYLGSMTAAFLVYILDIRKSLRIRYFLLSLALIFLQMAAEQLFEPGHYGNWIRAFTGFLSGFVFFLFFSPLLKKGK